MNTFLLKLNRWLLSPLPVLLFVLSFTVAYFVFAHEGFYWIDDYGYAKYAWQLTEGTFSVTPAIHESNPLTHRFMIFAPVAVFYQLFGISIYTTTLWPLLCTLGCVALLYLLFGKADKPVAVFGMLLLGLYFHTQFLATYLYPDNILMFFAFSALALLFRYRYPAEGRQPILYGVAFALFNFMAFLSKETIVYYLLFYIYLFGLDFFQKNHRKFWLAAIGFGAIMLAGYFGYYYSQTGAFFYRFHILAQTSLNYLEDFDLAGFYAHRLPRRLTYEPLFFFMASGIMVPFAFASGAWILTKKVSFFKLDKPEYFWHLVSGLVLLQFWFAPTSTADYIPITLVPRMATILVPPLCISAAYALTYFTGGNRKAAIYFSFIFLVCCFFDRNNTVVMYIALFLYFGWQAWRMRKPGFTVSAPFMVLVLTAVLVLRPLHFMRKPSVMEFQQQDKIVKEELNKPAGKHLVYTDPWTIMMYDFHYDFKPNAGYVYREFSAQKADSGKFDAVYLLVNRKGLINPDMAKLQTIQEDSLSRLFPVKKILRKEGEVRLFQLK